MRRRPRGDVCEMRQKRPNLNAALGRLAAAERQFLGSEFLAPVVGGGKVSVRIAGIVCRIDVTPHDFRGFGVFRATSHSTATLVREAKLAERRRYLQLFPRVVMVIARRDAKRGTTLAIPLNPAGETRFRVEGEADVKLCDEGDVFDATVARFDGTHFWFEQPDERADPAAAPYLRQALAKLAAPAELTRPGLMPGQRIAYALNFTRRVESRDVDERTRNERRLRAALEHAGADLRDFAEQTGQYRVTYDVDGERHVSIVRKDDLTVLTAGICLSGLDADFDLSSLVGVLREGRSQF